MTRYHHEVAEANPRVGAHNFARQTDHRFEIKCENGRNWAIGRSFFELEVQMSRTATRTQADLQPGNLFGGQTPRRPILTSDVIAPVLSYADALFEKATFFIGPDPVSQVVSENLAATLKSRISKSKAYTDTVGKNMGGSMDADPMKRKMDFVPRAGRTMTIFPTYNDLGGAQNPIGNVSYII